ncbi:MAG: helix-turn-helix transcriptional regulator [Methylotenera sp.]|uniref:helix-turn-helix domain-containing protein n=1 Tax=Methylotenera sp. TaxID=2051956 RepID=UPI00273048EA|nr:helix-turn-helix transcriptional regulator [Methylotenera sp.]MDP1524006.1 helix-turn-helix transcriptional regulator [Methylotenera sp.]
MEIKQAFASALKLSRKSRGLTQEDFADVSSRTYISTLERGVKSPTIEKVDVLAKAMGIHPLTLLFLTYLDEKNDSALNKLMETLRDEVKNIVS